MSCTCSATYIPATLTVESSPLRFTVNKGHGQNSTCYRCWFWVKLASCHWQLHNLLIGICQFGGSSLIVIGPKQPSQCLYSRSFSSGPLVVLVSSSLLPWQHLRTLSPPLSLRYVRAYPPLLPRPVTSRPVKRQHNSSKSFDIWSSSSLAPVLFVPSFPFLQTFRPQDRFTFTP